MWVRSVHVLWSRNIGVICVLVSARSFHRFDSVEVVPEVFSLGGFCRLINAGLNIFARYELVRKIFRVTIFPFVNVVGLVLEKLRLKHQ